ncbi:hypothetical protein FSP39_009175 [Pinctada imbricata]|uniref:Sushi domain-containing protein n=1 Tax=Pinctada imbricata TaxID=66713 RepID=A0AA89C565_PINIB|nr:hypothetical protein FSP39_009175 [Pinctada imbricata]
MSKRKLVEVDMRKWKKRRSKITWMKWEWSRRRKWKDVDDSEEEEKNQNDIGPCPVPEPIPHGKFSVWGDNLLIEYSCDPGFELLGNMFGACDISTGEWTVEPPICVSDGCEEPTPPENGFVSVKRQGKMAVFVCDRGHYLVGKDNIYCYGGNWSNPIPECKGASGHALFGKKIMVRNDTKPAPANKAPVVDFEAEIRKTDTTCFRYRRKSVPPKIEYADVETKYIYNKYRRLWVIVANYTCYEGFEIPANGSRYLFCQKYEWVSPVKPICVKIPVHPCEDENGGCSQLCIPGEENFYHCDCYRGFSVGRDGHTCEDRNECLISNGGCEQLCRNTHGSRHCLCREGFAALGNLCFGKYPGNDVPDIKIIDSHQRSKRKDECTND